jgi:uncharacterized repeat protein (TIGR03803 family)
MMFRCVQRIDARLRVSINYLIYKEYFLRRNIMFVSMPQLATNSFREIKMRYRNLLVALSTALACFVNLAQAQVLDDDSVQTTIHSFDAFDGGFFYPISGGNLVQGINGNLYGTTFAGGDNGFGTVFDVTPSGTLTTLYSFCAESGCPDGSSPVFGDDVVISDILG